MRPRIRQPVLVLLALTLTALAGACGGGDEAEPRRVVLIVLDAARADRFSCNGYERETTPAMDRLAARGVNFRSHFANGVATRNSMPTLMYSRTFAKPVFPVHLGTPFYRPEDLFRTMDAAAISMPAAFAADGFHTVGISAHQWFQEDSEYARQFEEFHDLPRRIGYAPGRATPRAEQVVDYALEWLAGYPQDEDLFLYLHLMDSHFPHFLDEDAAEFFGADTYAAERFSSAGYPSDLTRPLEGRDREYMDALYDGSLRYLDRHLGRLFAHLEETGQLDSTLVAITADHGEELLHQPGRFAHGSWWDPVAHIPMILSIPDRLEPKVVDALTENIDVLPTLLELMEVPLPPGRELDGRSLLEGHDDGSRDAVYAWCGLRTDGHKLLTNFRKLLGDEPWGGAVLYDLEQDPEERDNVVGTQEGVANALLEQAVERLQPRYDRYVSVDVDRQPTWEFAIEPRFARLPEVAAAPLDSLEDWRAAVESSGWARDDTALRSVLLAGPDVEPAVVELDVPSGEYVLSLAVGGSCRVARGPDAWITLDATPFDPGRLLTDLPAQTVGTVVAEDRRLQLRLAPGTSAAPFVVAGFQLRPVGVDAADDAARERAEALKQMGY